jgi:K+-transporting ATPase ATPase C chain
MFKHFLPALRLLIILTVLTGVLYPLILTLASQAAFPAQANGSLVEIDGQLRGSTLIGQTHSDPRYFWGRPSAVDYMSGSSPDALGSSGASNQGMTNAALVAAVEERAAAFRAAHNLPAEAEVPREMLLASGSGLDPHISPEAARLQVGRVAAARGLTAEAVTALVEEHIEPPQLGLFGQPRVNVLRLNLALDAAQP